MFQNWIKDKEMELTKITEQNPVLKALLEFSFLLTVVTGISFSIELFYRLFTKKLFSNKLIFRYLLFFKLVSDVLGLVSALASFSLEHSPECSLDLLVLFYPCHDVFSHLMVGAGSVSSFLTFIYCLLEMWDFVEQKDEGITASDICSTFIIILVIDVVVMINIVVLNNVCRLFPGQQFLPPQLFSSVLFWMDSVSIVVLFVAFIIFVSLKLKNFNENFNLFRNTDNKITTTTAIEMHEGDVTMVLITDGNDGITTTGKIRKNAKSCSKTYNNTELDPGSSKMKLFLFLLGVILVSFFFNCVFLILEINHFFYYEEILYSFFTTFSLIIIRMNK